LTVLPTVDSRKQREQLFESNKQIIVNFGTGLVIVNSGRDCQLWGEKVECQLWGGTNS
jgi:hypothetical protein